MGFLKNSEKWKIFKEYSIMIKKIETGTKYIVSGLKMIKKRRKRDMWVPHEKKKKETLEQIRGVENKI